MAPGYTRARVSGWGQGAEEIWTTALGEFDQLAPSGAPWTVGDIQQVYDRSAYLQLRPEVTGETEVLGPSLVLLAGAGFDGPLATRVEGQAPGSVPFDQLSAGDRCRLRNPVESDNDTRYVLAVGQAMDVEIDRSALTAQNVDPGPYRDLGAISAAGPVFDRGVAALECLTDQDADDGLGWLDDADQFLAEELPAGDFKSLVDWWTIHLESSTPTPPPMAILGRGPGLTPSGDDVLSGLLLALLHTTRGARHQRVRSAARRYVTAAERQTTAVSAALLAQAAQGRASDRLEAALDTILVAEPSERDLETTIRDVTEVGHTSGVDLLVGVLLATLAIAPRVGRAN